MPYRHQLLQAFLFIRSTVGPLMELQTRYSDRKATQYTSALSVLVDNPASCIIMSRTARVDTQPKTHFHQVRTSPRVRGHTLHTQGASEASLDH
jgi:hypothetical protein